MRSSTGPPRRSASSARPSPFPPDLTRLGIHEILGGARRALILGMGGGGDVVGALSTAELCRALEVETVLGSVAWERTPIDPTRALAHWPRSKAPDP
ncbi:MAG: DUF1152 domain-containing protein [Solirubrobacterales bacterium]|nr:DUF1152 domain-containing protein [Solirubrobacterales bacterium]